MKLTILKHLFLWVGLVFVSIAVNGVEIAEHSVDPQGMVSIERGISPIDVLAGAIGCDYVGTITLGGPFSLSESEKFFTIGKKQLTSIQLMVDYVNKHRCGVEIKGEKYQLKLETYDDISSKEWTNLIGSYLADRSDVDIMLGGYASGLTEGLANIANETGNLLLAPGAASTSVFKGRDQAFGTFPPTAKYTSQAVEALALAGAKSIATIYEDAIFTRGVCAAIPDLADQHGLEVTSTTQVVRSPDVPVMESLAHNLTEEDPDVVMTCVYDQGCQNWIEAMKSVDWSPKAQVFTICVGLQSFVDGVGDDSTYIMGVSPWDQSLSIVDKVTGWSPKEFATRYSKVTDDVDVTYHAGSATSVISIAVQAIEETNSLDPAVLADHISKSTFETLYGAISFDENGQSQAPSLLIQYDTEGQVQTVFPPEVSSGPILYPMPSWAERACLRKSRCEETGNKCSKEGICICSSLDEKSVGSGATTQCIPQEEMNYIETGLHIGVYTCVAVAFLFAVIASAWTFIHRNDTLVKVSQPICLALVIVGCIISTSSIIPMGYETAYRDSDDIKSIDLACMAVPWLWGLGFTITFSSLFAKIWRVKTLFKAASRAKRQKVGMATIIYIMGSMLALECVILLTFQFYSPHQWEREVLKTIDGFTLASEGHCTSDHGNSFWLALVIFNIACLVFALFLCFQTRNIPSDFAESRDISLAVMFMFQVLALAVPVSAMVQNDPSVFYFIRAIGIFLQNFTVLVIIFAPKMYRIYKGEDTKTTVRKSIAASASRRNRSSAERANSEWNNSMAPKRSSIEYSSQEDSKVNIGRESINSLTQPDTSGSVRFAEEG